MEKVHELRLFALLLDLVGRHGRRGAAEVLGVSYHAVARASSSGRLTGRVSDALARHLLEGGGAAASRRAGAVRGPGAERRGVGGGSGRCSGGGIVMDVMMPKKDGVEACREIMESLPETGVIMLTG